MTVEERIKKAEEAPNPSPTERQKATGNYKKGHIVLRGFDIAIENPQGSTRSGVDESGNSWSSVQHHSYGYFKKTIGKDGDPIDVYLGATVGTCEKVFIVDQIKKNKSFDEHKVMFGFESEDEASKAYLSNYEKGWQGLGDIVTLNINQFRKWLYNKKLTRLPASRMRVRIQNKKEMTQDRMVHIELMSEVIEGETLENLQSQITTDFDILTLEIGSPGGSVIEGLRIMQWLDKLAMSGKKIITVVSANAYSIASLIMLAAHVRYISSYGEVMIHNPMIPELKYANAEELETQAKELRELEDYLIDLYEMFTGADREIIRQMMDKETYISPEDAVKLNFAHEVIQIKQKPYVEAVNVTKHKIINMSKTLNLLKRVVAKIEKLPVVNQLYGTTDGGEIEIYQADPSVYQEGDKTNLESGEVQLADGSKLVIEDYLIKTIIKEVSPEEPEAAEEIVEPKEEPADFNEGPAPKDPEGVDPVDPTNPTEPITPIVDTEDPEAPETPVAPVEPVDQSKEDLVTQIKGMQATIDKLTKQIGEMQTDKMQEEISKMAVDISNINAKLTDFDKFQDSTAEAIDTIASHTESVWNPEPRRVAKPATTGKTIFARAKEQAGIK